MIIGIDDISIFKIFFDTIYEETDAVELACNSQGMKISILDKSHTCFYEVFYDATFFDLFDVDGVEVIVLDIDDLTKILKKSHKDDYLTLSSDDGDKVIAKFEHEDNRRVFELVQVVDFTESPVPPTINADCEVTISIDELSQSLSDFDIFKTGSCHMICGDGFVLSSKDDAAMNYSHSIDCDAQGTGDAYYTVDYLKNITKFKKVSNSVCLRYGDTMPLQWMVKNDSIRIQGLIAPRIESDD